MDQRNFESAYTMALKRLCEIKNTTTKNGYILKVKLGGLL